MKNPTHPLTSLAALGLALGLALPLGAGPTCAIQTTQDIERLPFFKERQVRFHACAGSWTAPGGSSFRKAVYSFPGGSGSHAWLEVVSRVEPGGLRHRPLFVELVVATTDFSSVSQAEARQGLYRSFLASFRDLPAPVDALVDPLVQAEADREVEGHWYRLHTDPHGNRKVQAIIEDDLTSLVVHF
jgi:hypothetical protein